MNGKILGVQVLKEVHHLNLFKRRDQLAQGGPGRLRAADGAAAAAASAMRPSGHPRP